MTVSRHVGGLVAALLLTVPSFSYAAEAGKDPYEDNLLGNWGGSRDKLADSGVDVTLEYKADLWSVTSGGIKRGENYMDNLDIKFGLDGEKIFGIKGNKALIYFLNNNGGKTNEHLVGSTQGVDNIETGTNTFKLYEAWDEQSFMDNKVAVLVGLHDLNSEFDVTDMTGNFIKPVMQIGQSFAQSGQNGPAVFPNASLAARVQVNPTESTYISAAAFEGVPGDPNRPHGTHVHLRSSDGALLIAEAGCTPKSPEGGDDNPNKFAVGVWEYTKKMDDLVDVDGSSNPIQRRMAGAYLLSSYQLFHNKDGSSLGAFLRGGIADGDTAQVDWDYEIGLVSGGWVPSRPDSEIGVGLAQAHNSNKYMQSVGGVSDRNEYSLELYYRDKLMKGVTVQPDIQYIMNPGTNPAVDNATLIGIRFDINF